MKAPISFTATPRRRRFLMSFLRNVAVRSTAPLRRTPAASFRPYVLPLASVSLHFRGYASRNQKQRDGKDRDKEKAKVLSTDDLVPASQRIVSSPEYVNAEEKMKAALDFFRKEVAAAEMRASGRVTPAVLAPVRVSAPGHQGADGRGVKLEEIATVGIRDGSMLLVTVFEEQVRVVLRTAPVSHSRSASRHSNLWNKPFMTRSYLGSRPRRQIRERLRYPYRSASHCVHRETLVFTSLLGPL